MFEELEGMVKTKLEQIEVWNVELMIKVYYSGNWITKESVVVKVVTWWVNWKVYTTLVLDRYWLVTLKLTNKLFFYRIWRLQQTAVYIK